MTITEESKGQKFIYPADNMLSDEEEAPTQEQLSQVCSALGSIHSTENKC